MWFRLIVLFAIHTVLFAGSGDLDNTFGVDGNGIVITSASEENNDLKVRALDIQKDGKIVVVGNRIVNYENHRPTYYLFLARYTVNGILDNSFGNGGIIYFGDDLQDTQPVSIHVLESGKLLVSTRYFNGPKLILARFDSNGSIDRGFGTDDGVTIFEANDISEASPAAVLIKNDKITILGDGRLNNSSYDHIALAVRYNENATVLDVAFGDKSGYTTSYFGEDTIPYIHDAVFDTQDRIFAVGRMGDDSILLRYESNGTLDRDFGENGVIKDHLGDASKKSTANNIAIQTDGKIVVTGGSDSDENFTLIRYLPTGDRDMTFGAEKNGVIIIPGATEGSSCGVAIQPDGKIIIAGTADGDEFFLSKYDRNGLIDKNFGDNGVKKIKINNEWSEANAMALQKDGKIILTGNTVDADGGRVVTLVRYLNSLGISMVPIYYLLQ
jgi:uncharacterized delta-60 repeat protein